VVSLGQHRTHIFGTNICAATAVRALTIAFVLTVVAIQAAQASTFNVIYNFTGGSDGTSPYAGLTIDRTGNLYGTTLSGGAGYGTVFKLTKTGSNWVLTTLYTFTGGNDGASPRSKVIIGPDGNLYGETFAGGGQGCGVRGCGTVFQVRKSCPGPVCHWTETVLYRFTGASDGGEPTGDLLFDSTGKLYGTTEIGGKPHSCSGLGCGTVYTLTPSGGTWTETVLYQFLGLSDGAFPNGGVIFDTSGNLYGTTCCGGSHNSGTVFKLTSSGSGWTESLLYNFQGSTDGNEPVTGLIFDASGDLYGSTIFGGTGHGGTVFELTPSGGGWTFSVLFSARGIQGPLGTLMRDAGGNLYGTTFQDGLHLVGSVFKLTNSGGDWTYSSFHDFTDGLDGGYPFSNLVFDSSGNLYGTGALGGTSGNGVVVEVTP
jgi:uncharacterized repeat protein (TIGR03803 family)